MNPRKISFFALILLVLFVGCTKKAVYDKSYVSYVDRANEKTEFELMAYNVENLFDHLHDEGKNDWAFTPKGIAGKDKACAEITNERYRLECLDSDWTAEKVDLKISQIKKVLTNERKHLPEILVLSEIENKGVVSRLAESLGYKHFYVSDSPDERGVDLAVLVNKEDRFKLVAKREIVLNDELFKGRPTRNILEVEFLVDGKYPLTLFANHWPSLRGPNELRLNAANALMKRVNEILAKNPQHFIVATGDFNTIPGPTPHPIDDILLRQGGLIDAHTLWERSELDKELKAIFPKGTYYYGRDKVWNQLDRIFLSANLLDGQIRAVAESFQIYAPEFIMTKEGTPKRYDHNASDADTAGFSDHFPILIKFNIR